MIHEIRFWWFGCHECVTGTEMVFVSEIVLTVRRNCSSDREKLLKFEAEGREFVKFLRSLEQFIPTVKGQDAFLTSS